MTKELVGIEWHDTQVESLALGLEGELKITFKTLSSFYKDTFGKIENWLSKAEILLKGVSDLSVK